MNLGVGLNFQTVLCGTVNGVIAVLAKLSEEQFIFLQSVQEALNKIIKGVGGLLHHEYPHPPLFSSLSFVGALAFYLPSRLRGLSRQSASVFLLLFCCFTDTICSWRSWSNERKTSPSHGFIDGGLVESLLDLSLDQQQIIADQVQLSVQELLKRIETLSRALH